MAEHIEKSVGVIVKGGAITFIGTMVANIAGFGSKVVIIRFTEPAVFGAFSICFSIVNIFYIMSTLGLSVGLARYIAFFKGGGNASKARDVSVGSIKLGSAISLLFCAFALAFADIISGFFSGIENLRYLLIVIFVSIPFYAVLELAVGIARGHGDSLPKVLFLDMLRNGLFFALIMLVLPFSGGLSWIIAAFVISVVASGVFSYFYVSKKYGTGFRTQVSGGKYGREILVFSLPLVVMPIMWLALATMDTVMLGYYRPPYDVGVYSASASVARVFNTITMPVMFMFLPVAAGYYARNSLSDMSSLYQIVTKWVFSLSLPFFAVLIIFSETIVIKLFGQDYAQGAASLQIITLGYLPSLILGINNVALTATGRTYEQMALSGITIFLNIVLNIILIPNYGLNGAAVATAIAYTAFNLMASLVLYRHSKIQPFSADFLKSLGAALVVFIVFYFAFKGTQAGIVLIGAFIVLFWIAFAVLLGVFKGFSRYDLMMLDVIEKKTGRDFSGLKRVVNRFVIARED